MNALADTAARTGGGFKPVDFASLRPVREIEGARPGDLADHPALRGDEPVVLRGLVESWPLTGKDDSALLDALAGYATEQPIPFYTAAAEAGGRVFYDDALTGFNFERRSGRFSDCCAWLKANAAAEAAGEAGLLYVGSTAVDGWLPGFSDDHPLDLGDREYIASLWLGNRARIAAHFDFPRNVACNVAGHRRFTLFPPQEFVNLYPGPLELTPSGQPISLVDFYAVDEARFPRFSRALEAAQVADLKPGDAVYVPSMWWHHVESLAPVNLLINYWWRDSALHLGSPYAALLHAALSIGQLSEEERGPWLDLFQHYVFSRDPARGEHIPAPARGLQGTVDREAALRLRQQLAQSLKH